jgi:hypothetical protein
MDSWTPLGQVIPERLRDVGRRNRRTRHRVPSLRFGPSSFSNPCSAMGDFRFA